jgi:hypothetical protein
VHAAVVEAGRERDAQATTFAAKGDDGLRVVVGGMLTAHSSER